MSINSKTAKMGEFYYQVVRHKNGWAYRLQTTYSEVFTTQSEAIEAAKAAAHAMHEPGDPPAFEFRRGRSLGAPNSLFERAQARIQNRRHSLLHGREITHLA